MGGDRIKKLLKSRSARIILLCLAALLLLLAVWKVFFDMGSASSSYQPTEREARLCQLLSGVEGIESATAMITEKDGIPVSAIVIFDGADSILTRIRVIDITAGALGIERKNVQIYPANQSGN